ncbi:MAG TPA: dienelactone hydrolase family protein [Stellaceae bacterium]|nr:dienelactone hydrolase family protein [Stellaceae bacterium]
MSTVSLNGASGYLVRAKTQRAGVVLLPTIFGVNPFVRDYAAALAADGISTLIWDIYPGEALPQGFDESRARAGKLQDPVALKAMTACVDFLKTELKIEHVGTIGFCLGGRFVFLLAARDRRIEACAAVYPSIREPRPANQPDDAVAIAGDVPCPVQLLYPGRDNVTSNDTFFRLQQSLQRRKAPTIVQYYPEADHGFMHNEGAANAVADRLARPQVSAFLAACLG